MFYFKKLHTFHVTRMCLICSLFSPAFSTLCFFFSVPFVANFCFFSNTNVVEFVCLLWDKMPHAKLSDRVSLGLDVHVHPVISNFPVFAPFYCRLCCLFFPRLFFPPSFVLPLIQFAELAVPVLDSSYEWWYTNISYTISWCNTVSWCNISILGVHPNHFSQWLYDIL